MTTMDRLVCFADWKLTTEHEREVMSEIGFTDVVLGMVDNQHEEFKPKYSNEQILENVQAELDQGRLPHIMIWMRRRRSYIIEAASWLAEIVILSGAVSGLGDAEGDWHNSGLSSSNHPDYISPAEGAQLFMDTYRAKARELGHPDLEIGISGLSGLHSSVEPLAHLADYVIPQPYSIWAPSEDHWSHSTSTTPGVQQETSDRSWGEVKATHIVGLSCYYEERPACGSYPAFSQSENLQACYRSVVNLGRALGTAWWSLKWLIFKDSDSEKTRDEKEYRRQFLRSLLNMAVLPDHLNDTSNVQRLLVRVGYDLGDYGPAGDGVDGKWGSKSQTALDSFRVSRGISRTGGWTQEDVHDLYRAERLTV